MTDPELRLKAVELAVMCVDRAAPDSAAKVETLALRFLRFAWHSRFDDPKQGREEL